MHAKREVAGLKKGQVTGKLVKEIMVAAKLGGADPAGNARLFAVVEKARRASVERMFFAHPSSSPALACPE